MNCWLYGLSLEERWQVEAILNYLGIDVDDPDLATRAPVFIVVGSQAGSVNHPVEVPIISLNQEFKLYTSGLYWYSPLPWRQETMQKVLKEIDASRKLPRRHALDLNLHVRHLESLLIRQALVSSRGVVSKAAASLQIQRTTLIEKMRRYKIDKSEF
ncbi:hypothetical protein TW85_00665 [Marinomonas sp. S3726]|uniref:helix-turn-helix domain-containing protein n=1 Tax=Marinomonas sp. S3726 TaxID=579484 RepID=UPI0005FA2DC5|nr:helix-turn-helix domain-containing protein [Marinomonas sp. S3726]KJZ16319.1 hypothetical protein TW85_00665 [Marinomonas sp. S3726]